MMMQGVYSRKLGNSAMLAFMLCAQPANALEAVTDNASDMPQTETMQLGTPLGEATLESASDELPRHDDSDMFSDVYDFAKRSGKSIVNGVKSIKFSSSESTTVQAAPVMQVSEQPAASATSQQQEKSSWDEVSDKADRLYERALHMFDNDSHN